MWRTYGRSGVVDLLASPSIHAAPLLDAYLAVQADLLERLASGEYQAWTRLGDELGQWTEIPVGNWPALTVTDWKRGITLGKGVTMHELRISPPRGLPPALALRAFGSLRLGDQLERGAQFAERTLTERLHHALSSGALVGLAADEAGPVVVPAAEWQTLHLDVSDATVSGSRHLQAVTIVPAAYLAGTESATSEDAAAALLRRADDADIERAMRTVYNTPGFPPNVNEAWTAVSKLLRAEDLQATKTRVTNVAERTEFKSRRAPAGKHRKIKT